MPQDSARLSSSLDGSRLAAGAESSVELVRRAQGGDEAAREALCARYLPRLRRWAHGRLPLHARAHLDTEDLVQDTLLQSLRRLGDLPMHHERAFCGYVCQALRNRIIDAVRHAARKPSGESLTDDQPASDPSPLDIAAGREALAQYEAALQRLSASDRELILAKVELGLDYSEIAELAGKASTGATRVAMSRALLRLAKEMSGERTA